MKRKDMAVFALLAAICVVGFILGIAAVRKTEIDISMIKNSMDGIKEAAPSFKSVVINSFFSNGLLFLVMCVLPASVFGFFLCGALLLYGGFATGFSCGYMLLALGVGGVFKTLFGVFLPSFIILTLMCKMSSRKQSENDESLFKKIVISGAYAFVFAVCTAFQGFLQYTLFYKL